ncbi:RNA-binding cell elongation regulator Jag/EloR [Qingrenia yutianensis]|mgnify:FL=1|nr:RNA-binding cell elongation regulator Jag/EloR [Qingrenia yutianensis]
MKTIEMVGKTVDDAVNAALAELNAKKEDVDVEVLEEGSKGFLGMGSKDAKVRVSLKCTPQNKAVDFLSGLFDVWGLNVKISTELDGDVLKVELEGDDMGVVIGKRGETLDALQHLTSLNVNTGDGDFVKVSLDTEGYREKRVKTLESLAAKLASKVAKTRHNVTLEPMNSYERRIIHASLQDNEFVTTYSVGQSPNRKVVIAYNRK